MRIGISAPRCASTPGSGVGRYVQGLVDALPRLDTRNEYFLMGPDPPVGPRPPNVSWEPCASGGRLGRLLWNHVGAAEAARRLKLDVLLAAKTVLPRALPCRGVSVVHDLAFLRHPRQYPWEFKLYWNRVMRGLVGSEHEFVCDSDATARDMIELLNAPERRVHTVRLGVDRSRFEPPPGTHVARRLRALGVEDDYVLFVGNVVPRKNVPRLVEAMRIVRRRVRVRLVVAGANLMKLKFGEGVDGVGAVSDDDLSCLYAGARLLAFPTLYEGFGLPVLEAMAAGCPVVASDRGSLREVGGDAFLSVDPERADSIAQGLLWVLQNADLAEALRAAGLRRARQFTWEEAARGTLDVLTGAQRLRAVG
jgi:glycosyltransferase involved in cell wall biosynthesis